MTTTDTLAAYLTEHASNRARGLNDDGTPRHPDSPHLARLLEKPNVYNNWPNLPLALRNGEPNIRIIENPTDQWTLARALGHGGYPLYVNIDSIPEAVMRIVRPDLVLPRHGNLHCEAMWAPAGGQTFTGIRNVDIVFAPRRLYGQGGDTHAPAYVVRLGCSHARLRTTKLGNCYHRYDCPDCSYSYTIDSGD